MEGCAPAPSSTPGVIDVWTWNLDRPATEVARLALMLSADESDRASRFAMPRDANRYVVARANLRIVLGNRLGIPPHQVTLVYNDYGKPHATWRGVIALHFNLSHSGGVGMLAVSDRFPLGIDIEEIKPLQEDIAGYFFSARERDSLERLPRGDYLLAFYRCWTRKEAIVKGRGEGLTIALDSFDVSVGEQATLDLSRLDDEYRGQTRWSLCNVEAPSGFQAAIAALTNGIPLLLRYYGDPGLKLSVGAPQEPNSASRT